MGLPQARERVFFISQRKDLYKKDLVLTFNEKTILFKTIKDENDKSCNISSGDYKLWKNRINGESSLADTNERMYNKYTRFTAKYIYNNEVLKTIVAGDNNILFDIPRHLNKKELCLAGSFPLDYDFGDIKPRYLIGMSVPPLMMAKLSYEIYRQLLT